MPQTSFRQKENNFMAWSRREKLLALGLVATLGGLGYANRENLPSFPKSEAGEGGMVDNRVPEIPSIPGTASGGVNPEAVSQQTGGELQREQLNEIYFNLGGFGEKDSLLALYRQIPGGLVEFYLPVIQGNEYYVENTKGARSSRGQIVSIRGRNYVKHTLNAGDLSGLDVFLTR